MSLDDPDLSALIRQQASRHVAPPRLAAGIRTQLALIEAARVDRVAARRGAAVVDWLHQRWRTAAGSFALGLACALWGLPLATELLRPEPLEAWLVGEHARALRAGPLFQVASSDRHTVKPWFQGRVDFAPPVRDLHADGFVLSGGRVAQVHGRHAAVLIYTKRQHVIQVFVWPGPEAASPSPSAPQAGQRRGFNLLQWGEGGMVLWAVSDMEPAEMARFAQAWQQTAVAAR